MLSRFASLLLSLLSGAFNLPTLRSVCFVGPAGERLGPLSLTIRTPRPPSPLSIYPQAVRISS